MMGRARQTEAKLFYHGLSLERRMPKDDPLRRIKQLVDFDFVRSQVSDLYGYNGNQSIDPAVILKLMFLLFYENIKSERVLMRKLPLRMDWLWFCDYDLDEETPDHSVLSKARKRWGAEVFDSFFTNILEQCVKAGLVDGETIHIDSSTINANASIDKVRPELRQVSRDLADRLGDEDDRQQADEERGNDDDNDKLETAVNPSDPDARIGRKYGKSQLGYKDHRVIDDRHGIITSTTTTPANIRDDKVLQESIINHQFKTGTKAKAAAADKIYGTIENYKFLSDAGIRACISHQRHGIKEPGKFPHEMFHYDKAGDCFVCPAGQKLLRYDLKQPSGDRWRYRADRQICEQCPSFAECVSGKTFGRQVVRNVDAEYVEWAEACFSRKQRRRLMGRRQSKAEGSFADAANNHGFKRARWRGLAKMRIQNLMIAAIQNLGKLLRYAGGTPKNAFCAAGHSLRSVFFCLVSAITAAYSAFYAALSCRKARAACWYV